jgi:hypothetical protein
MSDTIRGTGIIGGFIAYRATWPLASLTIDPESITIRVFPVKYTFDRSTIVRLQRERVWGGANLCIVHRDPAIPAYVLFVPSRFSTVRALLEKNGYEVTDDPVPPEKPVDVQFARAMEIAGYIALIMFILVFLVRTFMRKY